MNMEANVDNILATFRRATVAHYQEGINWYQNTQDFAREMDSNVDRAAGIIAAFSPQCNWPRNQELVERMYASGIATGHTGAQCAKATAIFDGADPLKVLGGRKTTHFYINIMDPYSQKVTIDGHAFDIAVGMQTGEWARKALKRKGVYQSFEDAYRAAAVLFNLPPAAMQAITWVAWREIMETKHREPSKMAIR